MKTSVEKIKERISIVDVVSSYLTLTQVGGNYKARCPFHNEKTPSFFVSPDRGTYYCFGCGAKGDIFSFVEHFEGIDFLGSLKLLAEKAGVTLDNNISKEKRGQYSQLYKIMEEATNFFEASFIEEKSPRAYLNSRGIKDETIKNFRIGFSPDKWKSVSVYLINKGFKKEDLDKVGLIKIKEDGSFYDRFRSRIIFPISDSSGRVIAFSGRIFSKEDDREAKYLNSPETPLFSKSNTLFGIDKAKGAIRRRGYSIVVEGQMDLVLSHQASFDNTVAVSGTALSDKVSEKKSYNEESKINNLGLIRRLSSNVIFAFDADQAGIRAVNRSSLIALSLGMQVKVAIIPEGKDPADVILENPNDWKEIIKNSKDIVSFHLNRICKSTTDPHKRGNLIKNIIFPLLSSIESSIEQDSYINLISRETGISENAITLDFEKYDKVNNLNKNEDSLEQNTEIKNRKDKLEEKLFGIIFWQNNSGKYAEDIKKICNSLRKNISEETFVLMEDKYKPNSSVLAFEAEIWYGKKNDDIVRDFKELALNLEEEILTEKLAYLSNKINEGEKASDSENINLILKNYQKIKERIENIKTHRTK